MSIETMPAALTWTAGAAVAQEVHGRFESHVTSAMWETVERIRCWNRQLAARLDRGIGEAGQDELQRVLLAPETTSRLLRHGPDADDAEVGRFVCRSFLAEAVRAGRLVQSDDVVWTALGDGRLLPSGEFLPTASIPGFVPLDVESPWPVIAGAPGAAGPMDRQTLEEGECLLALERLTGARDLIRKASGAVNAFVSRFARVLVLRRDDGSGPSWYTAGPRIGWSVLGDPHGPDLDEVDLTEAVVHGAVHAHVCMQELLEPWIIEPVPAEPAARIVSPWTGRPLAVSAFLRECFVRYGLLNFWCLVLGVGASDPERIRERICDTVRGFVAAPLLDVVAPHAGGMSEGVKSAIGQIQKVVGDCFDAVVA